jgi:hypothetical protein
MLLNPGRRPGLNYGAPLALEPCRISSLGDGSFGNPSGQKEEDSSFFLLLRGRKATSLPFHKQSLRLDILVPLAQYGCP